MTTSATQAIVTPAITPPDKPELESSVVVSNV